MKIDCLTLEIRILANCLYQKALSDVDDNLTIHQYWILEHIIVHHDHQVTQKEIEELFSIKRSTANHMFRLMEKNGYIIREVSREDARMKVILITEAGTRVHDRAFAQFQKFEMQLKKDFSEEELKTFRSMMLRIWNNANSE